MLKTKVFFLLSLIFCLFSSKGVFSQNPQWINYTDAIISDFQVNENAGPNGAPQSDPSTTSDRSGNIVITWTDERNGDEDIYAQRYACDGSTLGINFKFNVEHENEWWPQEGYSIDGSDNFVITWSEHNLSNGDIDIFAQRFASDGSQLGGKFKVNDDTGTECQRKSSVSMDRNGNFVIAWSDDWRNSDQDIYAQRYASDGTTLGGNFKVNDDVGMVVGSHSGPPPPSISTDISGNFVITWTDARNGGFNFDYFDIYAQRYSSDGIALGSNFKVNDDTIMSVNPSICTDTSSNFVITWTDKRNADSDIYAQRYSSDASALGTNFKVNDDQGSADQRSSSISTDSSGNYIITWVDKRNGDYDTYAQRYASDGAVLGTNFKVNDDQGSAWSPSISTDSSGNFIIAWSDGRNGDGDIYVQRYANDGTPFGNNFKVNDDQGSADQRSSSISTDSTGNFVITWTDKRNGHNDIYAQLYSSDGCFLGMNFKIICDSGTVSWYDPSLSTDRSGNFVITWGDNRNGNWDIYAQRYSSDGTVLGTNFKVNDDPGSTNQYEPSVAVQADGNFVITWRDHRGPGGIYAQRYGNDGSAIGANFRVTDNQAILGHSSVISLDRNGNFVITWEAMDIYAQRYSNDGSPLGTNFRVNDLHGSPYWDASLSISTDGSGNFVISWTDERNGHNNIYAQRYASDGTVLGTNFKVNDDQGSTNQYEPSVSVQDNGNFVITWTDARNADSDIYAQRYTNDGSTLGSNFMVTNTSKENQSEPDVKLWNGRIYNTWKDNRTDGTGYDIWANVLDWNNPVSKSDKELSKTPSAFVLNQNYPNPFNPSTTIEILIPKSEFVTLIIYNLLGQEVSTLVSEKINSGKYQYTWNAGSLASGVYLYQIQAGNYVETKKMVLVR